MTGPFPVRIQRQRTAGWRMPEGAVYVGRPTRWGNVWRKTLVDPKELPAGHPEPLGPVFRVHRDVLTDDDQLYYAADADFWLVANYWDHVRGDTTLRKAIRLQLAGRDLACWCPLDRPCHAEALLDIANDTTALERAVAAARAATNAPVRTPR